MANLLDYLDWRGDLTLAERPFNEVDNLLLAELSYLEFGGAVPDHFSQSVTLREAVDKYDAQRPSDEMGVLVPDQIPLLARRMAASARFGGMRLCGYRSEIDGEMQMQFSAVSAILPDGRVYAAFRGTDDTIVGWKEDFNLAFLPVVPAQVKARGYLQEAAAAFSARRMMVGGHSKGGNLAVYAAVFCGEPVQDRIDAVFNNDGPGFSFPLLERPEHARIAARIRTIIPESSVIGMLLEHEETYEVVRSTQSGLMQHDGFSWQVRSSQFERLPGQSLGGRMIDQTLHRFICALSEEQRVMFVDALFEILTCTDADTLTDLQEGGLRTALAMIRKYRTLDKPARQALAGTLQLFVRAGARTAANELHPLTKLYAKLPLQKLADALSQD